MGESPPKKLPFYIIERCKFSDLRLISDFFTLTHREIIFEIFMIFMIDTEFQEKYYLKKKYYFRKSIIFDFFL